MLGVLAGFASIAAGAQNLDAGKSPAQIFADTCSACHRRAQELKKPSAGFLRSHYTTSQDEASAMASYLARIPSEGRSSQQKKQSGAASTETRPTRRQEQSKEPAREQPKEGSKSRRSRNVEEKGSAPAAPAAPVATATPAPAAEPAPAPAAAPATQAAPAEPHQPAAPAPPARPAPEPFEE
jgi:hypothetical protein